MRRTKAALLGCVAMALTGCNATSSEEGGGTLRNFLLYGGATVPAAAAVATDDVYCPTVAVIDGGAAIQAYAGGRTGDAEALRSQIALGQLARECNGRPDGSTVVKVGIQGRALIGMGGRAGRFDVPVRIVVKRGNTVIANRVRRTAVTIPAGDTQADFVVVEDGIVVPAQNANDFEIEVGLGSGRG